MRVIYNTSSLLSSYDQYGHYQRTNLIVTGCSAYANTAARNLRRQVAAPRFPQILRCARASVTGRGPRRAGCHRTDQGDRWTPPPTGETGVTGVTLPTGPSGVTGETGETASTSSAARSARLVTPALRRRNRPRAAAAKVSGATGATGTTGRMKILDYLLGP